VSRSVFADVHIPLSRSGRLIIAGSLLLSALAGLLVLFQANAVLIFVVSAGALALLAALVGQATEQVGEHLGSGATGVLQSALGNLPELFVGIFALRAGLIVVVQSAILLTVKAVERIAKPCEKVLVR
jgi:Ca2+:H+ antiporter